MFIIYKIKVTKNCYQYKAYIEIQNTKNSQKLFLKRKIKKYALLDFWLV